MKNYKNLFLLCILSFITISCFEDNDDIEVSINEINDFVWKGLNTFYLYKDDVPNLADSRFNENNTEYSSYLNDFNSPRDLFSSLIFQPNRVDRFSRLFSDYLALEQLLDGIFTTNGMEYQEFKFSSTDTNVFGIVTHVLPNSSAADQGVKRGDIFYGIDGVQLTTINRSQLTSQSNYTINIGSYKDNNTPDNLTDDFIDQTTETITLNKSQYSENPIFKNDIFNIDNNTIGYLMYNGFTSPYDSQLNATFETFKNSNIDALVLDLRYNGGGSVASATLLASLITGQFTGKIMNTEEWNPDFQAFFLSRNPEALNNRFIDSYDESSINSLGLSKVYVLTTGRSASASELIINSLRPYIQVVQIGTTTTGKYQASTIIYDSPNFRRQGANPGHTYAMLPLIYKSINANGITDYFNGLTPDIRVTETINNLGVLGHPSEPLLAAAIANITGNSRRFISQKSSAIHFTNHSKEFLPSGLGMYSDKEIPTELFKDFIFE